MRGCLVVYGSGKLDGAPAGRISEAEKLSHLSEDGKRGRRVTKKTRKLDYNPARFEKAGRAAERAAERISGELDNLLDGLHPDVSASYALTRLVQRLIELQPLLLDMIVTHGLVDLGELVASLPLNALVERRKLAKRTRET